jgi:uncharacterized protein (DUF924 family)
MSSPQEVLEFWFSDEVRSHWWVKDPAFDEQVRSRLGALHGAAARGELDGWAATADGALALVLLLDQVPRNIHRGSPDSFSCDAKARAVTKAALAAGHDGELADDSRRLFLYLPLEHSEELADQERCLELMRPLEPAQWYDFAVLHHRIIARFGRFPHRNQVLGRESTPEEIAFLDGPNSSF